MAPKRRATSTRSAGPSQSTLSFHGRSSRVSKPTGAPAGAKAGKGILEAAVKSETKPIKLPEPEPEETPVTSEIEEEDEAKPVVVPRRSLSKADQAKAHNEEAAKKLPESKIKSYWREKEKERRAPRVHQQGLSVNEKILREWDTNSRFGVS
jgi:DNA polymerase delta subunit 4